MQPVRPLVSDAVVLLRDDNKNLFSVLEPAINKSDF
jgi:hypothetical protein